MIRRLRGRHWPTSRSIGAAVDVFSKLNAVHCGPMSGGDSPLKQTNNRVTTHGLETGSGPVERAPMLSEILGIDNVGDEVAAEYHGQCIL